MFGRQEVGVNQARKKHARPEREGEPGALSIARKTKFWQGREWGGEQVGRRCVNRLDALRQPEREARFLTVIVGETGVVTGDAVREQSAARAPLAAAC